MIVLQYITFLVQVILGTGFPSASQFNFIIESFLVSIFPPDVTDLIRDGTVTQTYINIIS